jgi:hypothetical protein
LQKSSLLAPDCTGVGHIVSSFPDRDVWPPRVVVAFPDCFARLGGYQYINYHEFIEVPSSLSEADRRLRSLPLDLAEMRGEVLCAARERSQVCTSERPET